LSALPSVRGATAGAAPIAEIAGLQGARTVRLVEVTEAEVAAHGAFLKKLKEPLWLALEAAT
jgi:DNA polymerase-3 subunit epsilon